MADSVTIGNFYSKSLLLALLPISILFNGCGGGGGSDRSSETGGRSYVVTAPVSSDTCGERVATVQQRFSKLDGPSGPILDTSLTQFDLVSGENGLEGGFTESNGDCTRDYTVIWPEDDGGEVLLRSKTTCPTVSCQTEWRGMAAVESQSKADIDALERVRGENCNPAVPTTVGYRASLFECNGNAAVLLSGNQRNNYSVVVRRDGQFNDRDPANPSCGTNRCSPYKTQKRIELPQFQANCLGDSGYSPNYAPVNRISIKYVAQVLNANDTNQFEQYCLTSTTVPLN